MDGFSLKIANGTTHVETFFRIGNDSFTFESSAYYFAVEGVILNKSKILGSEFANLAERLLQLYILEKEEFVNYLDGDFRGFIWDKSDKKLVIFTNPTGTQRLFYHASADFIYIDSSLVRMQKLLKKAKVKSLPDLEAIYQLLACGNILEDKTPIKNIQKLENGHLLIIRIQNLHFVKKNYFNLEAVKTFEGTEEEALLKIHTTFTEAIKMEYQKDIELSKPSLSLLSGGLDSRVAMLYALNNNFKTSALCFSQTGYLDQTISAKIAADYEVPYEFVPLDRGAFLKNIDILTEISEGTSLYTGGIHVYHALTNQKNTNFQIFHSGQIGDGILGGFNTKPFRKKAEMSKIILKPYFLPKIERQLQQIIDSYDSEEMFYFRNIACNRTVLGAQVFQQKAYQTSPFMAKEFIKLAYSLPEKWKFNQGFYLKWIAKYCPDATEYIWERTLLKPNAKWKTRFGDYYKKITYDLIQGKILGNQDKIKMCPYQFYYDESLELQNFYKNYFAGNIERLDSYETLQKEVQDLFNSGDFLSKSQAVNILAIFKLYF